MIKKKTLAVLLSVTALLLCLGEAALVRAGESPKEEGFIDTHLHVQAFMPPGWSKAGAGRRGPRPQPGRRSAPRGSESENLAAAADNLIAQMDRYGIEKALVVVVPSQRFGAEEVYRQRRALVARHPRRLGLMAGGALLASLLQETDPARVTDEHRERLRSLAERVLREGAVGFGEMISYHLCLGRTHSFQVMPADHPLFLLLADIAAENDVPVDVHMEAVEHQRPMPENLRRACVKNPATLEPTVPALERLLAHNRRARIVWQHIGWDNAGEMRVELLRRLLAAHPNLYLALRVEKRPIQVGGGRQPMPNRIVDRSWRIRPEWRALIEEFPDRFMIGSDEFFFPTESDKIAESFDETWPILKQLPAELARRVGRENAIRVYRLDRDS